MTAVSRFGEGRVTLTEEEGKVVFDVDVCHFLLSQDGEEHGMHVHEFGDVGERCMGLGGHFKRDEEEQHGGRESEVRHAGDLGNVVSMNGCVKTRIEVEGKVEDFVGRGLVFHQKTDDLGEGGDEESLLTGNAGGRLLCSPIVRMQTHSSSSSST